MEQVRLSEMNEIRKLAYVEPNRKRGVLIGNILLYVQPVVFLLCLIVYACIETENVTLLRIVPFGVLAIGLVLAGAKIRGNAISFYEEIMQERVWDGYIEDFQMNQEIEFVDKNGQTLIKKFTNKDYEKYVGKGRTHVIYIPKYNVWYMENR